MALCRVLGCQYLGGQGLRQQGCVLGIGLAKECPNIFQSYGLVPTLIKPMEIVGTVL